MYGNNFSITPECPTLISYQTLCCAKLLWKLSITSKNSHHFAHLKRSCRTLPSSTLGANITSLQKTFHGAMAFQLPVNSALPWRIKYLTTPVAVLPDLTAVCFYNVYQLFRLPSAGFTSSLESFKTEKSFVLVGSCLQLCLLLQKRIPQNCWSSFPTAHTFLKL